MADKGNITIFMQGMRASSAMDSVFLKPQQTQQAAAIQSPEQDDSNTGNTSSGTSLAEQGRAHLFTLSEQHPELHSMLTSNEAFLASVSRQVVANGFRPIQDPFGMSSW